MGFSERLGTPASSNQPDIFFAHNDHQEVLVFALDLQGHEHARMVGQGATATDIEDIALGPCFVTSGEGSRAPIYVTTCAP